MKKLANELSRAFSKEKVQMPKNQVEKCSLSLAIKEMLIKTTLRFHLTPVKSGYFQEHKQQQQILARMWGKRDPHTLLVECKLVQLLWKTVWRLFKKTKTKTKTKLPFDPAIPLLKIYLKECKLGYNKGTCTPMVIAALFMIVKLWNQPRCPMTDK
jgi:hypothetical protein